MRNILLSSIVFVSFTLVAIAEESRYETASVSATAGNSATNSITIADYETGEFIDVNYATGDGSTVQIIKDGATYNASAARTSSSGKGTTVRGPATFLMSLTASSPRSSSFMTVKITPVSFVPDKTLIIPPGTNQIQISLESSTNLLNWINATNGVYGSPTTAQFFRIKMVNLN